MSKINSKVCNAIEYVVKRKYISNDRRRDLTTGLNERQNIENSNRYI